MTEWVVTVDDELYHLGTGARVKAMQASSGDWRVQVLNIMNVPTVCLQTGFATEEEAKEALASAFENAGIEPLGVLPPEEDDETEDDDDMEPEVELQAYDEMTVDQLKAELAARPGNLPTTGNKADLINRLIEFDEKNAEDN